MSGLDRESIGRIDPTGQLEAACSLPFQLRDAVARFDAAGIMPHYASGGLVVVGMGGSAVGGRLAVEALADPATTPMVVNDDYMLPGWVRGNHVVLCSSYSGTTRETLSCYEQAGRRGAPRIVATAGGELADRARMDGVRVVDWPDGYQPRAAVGYALVTALLAERHGVVSSPVREEIEAAAALAELLVGEWGPDSPSDSPAKMLAEQLAGTVPVILGAELAAPVAYRAACQFNENANVLAFSGRLPEVNHNMIVGWPQAAEQARFAAILLEDPAAHPENRLRAELTAELVRPGAAVVERVVARGKSRTERIVSLLLFVDLVSLYTAILLERDPVEIRPIDALKARMAGRLA